MVAFDPQTEARVERVRYRGELDAAKVLRADAALSDLLVAVEGGARPDAARVRREIMSRSVLLTESMAPEAWSAARSAATALGVTEPLELFQSAGAENAAVYQVQTPILLEIRGRLLPQLDARAAVALFGHELGHVLSHGAQSPTGPLGVAARVALAQTGMPEHALARASALAMAQEITADRWGLLAVRDLDAALRLEMVVTTGLSASELTLDTGAYLAQVRALVEASAGDGARGSSHPEHGVRAWALWLFYESVVYQQLTGEGPGTRDLSDVDAQIAAVLGGAPPADLLDAALALEPVPEVHECALAAGALVALADGELSEAESLALERMFAPLVPDWARLLNWDNALEAFSDTGAVVTRGGARVQKSVFHVLVHLLTADGEVKASEVDMVCSIGDALQCGALYRAMLSPVLQALGHEAPALDSMAGGITLPARQDEAESALRAFFRGMERRGGGECTPRRLYQLLGDRDGSTASRATIARLAQEAGLSTDVDLARLSLDQGIQWKAAPRAVVAPPPVALSEPGRLRLVKALGRLRDALVSGDGRSPSIRLRAPRAGRHLDMATLESLSVGHADRVIALVQAGEIARLVDGKEAGVQGAASALTRDLIALEREALLSREQSGAQDLYLGTPFLTGVFEGYLFRAPLLLYPVELSRAQGQGFSLRVREGESAVVNQALVRTLFTKKRATFPDALGDELDQAAEGGVDAVREVLAAHGLIVRPEGSTLTALAPRDEAFATWPNGRLVLEPCAALGFFPQSASDLIQDYDALIAAVQDPAVALGERLGTAAPLLPADLREALGVVSLIPPSAAPLVPAVSADPAQLQVLRAAREARTLVVDGPPGTGKSQVIVNLVADALAQGQTVAVVAEKRAALDVVAMRLEQLGMRHLFARVHDIHEDRRGLFDQVVARLQAEELHTSDAVQLDAVRHDLGELERVLGERRSALAVALGEGQPTLGQLHLLVSAIATPPLPGLDPSLLRQSHQSVRALASFVAKEADFYDLHGPQSLWRAPQGPPRPSLSGVNPAQLQALEAALEQSRATAAALDRHRDGIPEEAVLEAEPWLRHALASRVVRDAPGSDALFLALMNADETVWTQWPAVLTHWGSAPQWAEAMPEAGDFEPSPALERALVVITRQGNSFFRFLSLAWWQARGVLRAVLSRQWPMMFGTPVRPALAARVRERIAGAAAWRTLHRFLDGLGISPPLADTAAAAAWVARATELVAAVTPIREGARVLREAGAWPETISGWERTLEARLAYVAAARAHRAAFAPVRAIFPWCPQAPSGAAIEQKYRAWIEDVVRIIASDRNLDAASHQHPSARALAEALAVHLPGSGAGEWADALEAGWAAALLALVERQRPEVRLLDRPTPYGEVAIAEAKLSEALGRRAVLEVAHTLAQRDRVAILTEARPDKGRQRTPLQKAREVMLREASKKRNVLSLRGFTRAMAPEGLMELLPVWLLSPETMAVLFPPEPVFDLIVVDEASQCTVESGFPALVRGRRAVIAGDERQMPPSSFFALSAGQEEEIGTAETVERDALSAESLLVLARERCPHQGLRWHYRCAHEELIAFSNYAMYGAQLLTIPSIALPDAPAAIRWIEVPDGAYEGGANPREAEVVVDQIAHLLEVSPSRSIGVVTFNIQQRKVILDALDARAEADLAFGERWKAASAHPSLDQRPFVKNLESVQGDERDIILFSLGHAPVERASGPLKGQRYVPARFGPLGQAGGERRLNVAVSRARHAIWVVASFTPDQLSVAGTSHEGPKLFKDFLQFAWEISHGRRVPAQKTLERVGGNRARSAIHAQSGRVGTPSLAAQIGLRLQQLGVSFDLDVGTSGFRVPLALRDAASYRVAVLTDMGMDAGDVLESHHHQPGVLRFRGWRVERVDSRTWARNPEAVLERLQAALRAATQES